jgi:protein LSM14
MEVPATDFDFESANAKFNKHDLAKEAIASGSPLGSDIAVPPASKTATNGHAANGTDDVLKPALSEKGDIVIPAAASYNKSTSFFDNISSELKDREESRRLGGQEFRSEERKKNLETFGQGSVDGYRGGFRGRGRGRGFGRGRSGFRGRGGASRGRGAAQSVVE